MSEWLRVSDVGWLRDRVCFLVLVALAAAALCLQRVCRCMPPIRSNDSADWWLVVPQTWPEGFRKAIERGGDRGVNAEAVCVAFAAVGGVSVVSAIR